MVDRTDGVYVVLELHLRPQRQPDRQARARDQLLQQAELDHSDTNAASQTRTVTKDSQGQTISVVDAASHTTSYAYDPFGKMIRTTDAVGNIVTATYDVRGRTSRQPQQMRRGTDAYSLSSSLSEHRRRV